MGSGKLKLGMLITLVYASILRFGFSSFSAAYCACQEACQRSPNLRELVFSVCHNSASCDDMSTVGG